VDELVDVQKAIPRSTSRAIRALVAVRRAASFVVHDPALALATAMLAMLVVLATIGPLVWTKDPLAVDIGASLQAPSWEHPMGTDDVGRDVFARFNEGAKISLAVGAVVVLVGAAIGGVAGLVSGVFGSWADAGLMRVMDAILAFPPLILAMAVTVGLGAGAMTATLGIIVTTIPFYARLVRSEVLRLRSLLFVEAAAAIGASPRRIIVRHIAPHTLPTLLIQGAAVFGYAILSLAALGFVGLGVQIPTPEWGTMITSGLNFALTGQWWISVFPGIGVLVAVAATSIIADRARDILDPRGQYAYV
jgi:peptide/nickel transport system permease protein